MRQPWRIIQHSYIVEEVGLFSAGRHQRAAMPRRAHLTWALESSVRPLRGKVYCWAGSHLLFGGSLLTLRHNSALRAAASLPNRDLSLSVAIWLRR